LLFGLLRPLFAVADPLADFSGLAALAVQNLGLVWTSSCRCWRPGNKAPKILLSYSAVILETAISAQEKKSESLRLGKINGAINFSRLEEQAFPIILSQLYA